MIKSCPLCQKPLFVRHILNQLYDGDSEVDFTCKTIVKIALDSNWRHFNRIRVMDDTGYDYMAVVPPFVIRLTIDLLRVERVVIDDDTKKVLLFRPIVYEMAGADYKQFVKICHKFQNLKAFA